MSLNPISVKDASGSLQYLGAFGDGTTDTPVSFTKVLVDTANAPVGVPGNVMYTGPQAVDVGGYTPGYLGSVGGASSQLKGSAGVLAALTANNTTNAVAWLRIYDKASSVDQTTDVPVWVEQLPAGPSTGHPSLPMPGLVFQNGIQVRCTTAQPDTDNVSPAVSGVSISYALK